MRETGMTLIELIVVLAIIGIILGVTGLALAALRPRENDVAAALSRARADAIHTGTPRRVQGIRFLPDGRAVGSHIDPLIGRPDAQ